MYMFDIIKKVSVADFISFKMYSVRSTDFKITLTLPVSNKQHMKSSTLVLHTNYVENIIFYSFNILWLTIHVQQVWTFFHFSDNIFQTSIFCVKNVAKHDIKTFGRQK